MHNRYICVACRVPFETNCMYSEPYSVVIIYIIVYSYGEQEAF